MNHKYNNIKCTEPDGMSEKEFIACIELLGATYSPDKNSYFILAKITSAGSSCGNTIDINALHLRYKNITYPLGEYKRLLYKIVKDIKEIRNLWH